MIVVGGGIKEGDIVTTKANSWMGVIKNCRDNPAFDYEIKWFADLKSGAPASFTTSHDTRVLRLYERVK